MTVGGHAGFALLAGGENSREHAVELFNRKVLADVPVRPRVEGSMHLLFVVADAGENDDRKRRIQLSHKGDERNSVHFGHLKIDNGYLAVVLREPGRRLEAIGQSVAGVTALTQIRDQELSDARVVIDDEELRIVAFSRLHCYNLHNQQSTILANLESSRAVSACPATLSDPQLFLDRFNPIEQLAQPMNPANLPLRLWQRHSWRANPCSARQ